LQPVFSAKQQAGWLHRLKAYVPWSMGAESMREQGAGQYRGGNDSHRNEPA